jgi:Na+-driven multidrug efflux pump
VGVLGRIADHDAAGYGVVGGWAALVAYVVVLGTALLLRWRSGAWRRHPTVRA